MRKTKAQSSVEYMMIIGFATVLTVPLLIIYFQYSASTKDSVATSQAIQVSRKIVDATESVYYLGKPSQTTLKVNFPSNIDSIYIGNRSLVFGIKTTNGLSDIVQVASVNISGTLPTSPGIHIITIRAEDGYVDISSN